MVKRDKCNNLVNDEKMDLVKAHHEGGINSKDK